MKRRTILKGVLAAIVTPAVAVKAVLAASEKKTFREFRLIDHIKPIYPMYSPMVFDQNPTPQSAQYALEHDQLIFCWRSTPDEALTLSKRLFGDVEIEDRPKWAANITIWCAPFISQRAFEGEMIKAHGQNCWSAPDDFEQARRPYRSRVKV